MTVLHSFMDNQSPQMVETEFGAEKSTRHPAELKRERLRLEGAKGCCTRLGNGKKVTEAGLEPAISGLSVLGNRRLATRPQSLAEKARTPDSRARPRLL